MRFPWRFLWSLVVFSSTGIVADDKPVRLEEFVIPKVAVKAADSDAPLSEGWPGGTAPGMIEIKKYPAYRCAVARGKGASVESDSILFFPLFNHISRSEIAMTTPVVSTYTAEMLEKPKATGDVTMEFVYRSPSQGQAGPGVGAVKVEDHPAATYVCLGVQGDLDADRLRKGSTALKTWLAAHKREWVEDGPARRIGYHGPMTPRDQRLWEVQVPVKPVTTVPAPDPSDKP